MTAEQQLDRVTRERDKLLATWSVGNNGRTVSPYSDGVWAVYTQSMTAPLAIVKTRDEAVRIAAMVETGGGA